MMKNQLDSFRQRVAIMEMHHAVTMPDLEERVPQPSEKTFNRRELMSPGLCFVSGAISVVAGTLVNRVWGTEIARFLSPDSVEINVLTPFESGVMGLSIVLLMALGLSFLSGMRSLAHVTFLASGLCLGQLVAPGIVELARAEFGLPFDRTVPMVTMNGEEASPERPENFRGLERGPLPRIGDAGDPNRGRWQYNFDD